MEQDHKLSTRRKIWAIGSGKGGVGKSIMAAALGIGLSKLGQRVIAIDLDFGNANLHSFLSVKYPRRTIADFLSGKFNDMNSILIDTPITSLKLISGIGGNLLSSNPWHAQKLKIMRYIDRLEADHIIIDLGAGTSYNTIDFFLSASDPIVITTPETTAIQNVYNFLRTSIFRILQNTFRPDKEIRSIVEKVREPTRDGNIIIMDDIKQELNNKNPEAYEKLSKLLDNFHPNLIMNMVLSTEETKFGPSIRDVVKKYLGIRLDYSGYISFDKSIRSFISSGILFLVEKPNSKAAIDILNILPRIITKNETERHSVDEILKRELRREKDRYATKLSDKSEYSVDPSVSIADELDRTVSSSESELSSKESVLPYIKMKNITLWSKIAIDLGTTNTRFYVKDKGIVLNEPSMIAIEEDTSRVMAVGNDAKTMYGRSHEGIQVQIPVSFGAIADFRDVQTMLNEFLRIARRSIMLIRPSLIITIPMGITEVEKRAVVQLGKGLGAREIFLVYKIVAAAIGAGLPVDIPGASMIVNVGGSTTSIAVISLSGIVEEVSVRMGGKQIDQAIIRHFREEHNFLIGEQTSEWLKINYGSAIPKKSTRQMKIRGQDISLGIPRTFKVSVNEIQRAMARSVHVVLNCILQLLEKLPPELSSDLLDRGCTLTGGGSLLNNLGKLIEQNTGLHASLAPDAPTAAVEGIGQMLDDFSRYSKFFVPVKDVQVKSQR